MATNPKRYQFIPITQNKYYLPENIDPNNLHGENIIPSTSQQSSEQLQVKKIKIPPIYLHTENVVNYQEIIKDIDKTITDKNYTTLSSNKYLRINLSNSDDFRKLTKFYDDTNIPYHTFQNPQNKPLQVVMKNVPLSLTDDEIKTKLINENYPVISVNRLKNYNKKPLPICAINLINNEEGKQIYKMDRFEYCIVSIEARRKPKTPPQCFRCQRYGHTKNYCHLTPRCVKCLGAHFYKECNKDDNTKPQCVNCSQDHPANFKGCTFYQELLKKNVTNQRLPELNFKHQPASPNYTNKRTYTDAVRGQPSALPNSSNESTSSILDNIIKFIKDMLNQFLPQIKTYIFNNIIPQFFNGP